MNRAYSPIGKTVVAPAPAISSHRASPPPKSAADPPGKASRTIGSARQWKSQLEPFLRPRPQRSSSHRDWPDSSGERRPAQSRYKAQTPARTLRKGQPTGTPHSTLVPPAIRWEGRSLPSRYRNSCPELKNGRWSAEIGHCADATTDRDRQCCALIKKRPDR